MKVLVAHGQEAMLASIKRQLAKWQVELFDNGLDALLAARAVSFDLILCGKDLPVLTSIEMVRSIRNFSVNKTTPVILLADGTETEEHERIYGLLNANLLTMDEVEEMKNLKVR
jgi:DNA-binding response OmpR family regulator